MRRIHPKILIPVFLLVALALAATSWARPGNWGRMNLTPEQAAQVFDLKHQFMNDTANLRKQMWVKRAEMAQLWKAEKPDEKAIVAKQKELNALRDQMMEKSVALRLKMKQIAPELGRFGFGRGMGPGRGMGRGMGMGPGACFGPGGPGFGPGPDLSEAPDMQDSEFDLSMALTPAAE
ncbi:MAG: periplasmic heavy metal sensor [Deltaproteobacteria bacterium]|nr:periplasmic heavy metal sensor [Deltaproteobacteria bacterium]